MAWEIYAYKVSASSDFTHCFNDFNMNSIKALPLDLIPWQIQRKLLTITIPQKRKRPHME